MRQLAEDGQLGTLLQHTYIGGSPALLHGLSHAVDTALFLLGNPEVEFVQATFSQGEYDAGANRWTADPHVAQAYIGFRHGLAAHFCVQGARWYSFSLVGTTGIAEAYDNNARYRLSRRSDDWYGSEDVPFPAFDDESDTVVAIRELTQAIATATPEGTSGPIAVAHKDMEILCAMAESHLRDGGRVRLPLENRTTIIPSR
jgi:predicted dehydrogenase